MKLHLSLALLLTASWALPAPAAQLISNPGIEGSAPSDASGDVHVAAAWGSGESDAIDKWWTGDTSTFGGHCSTGGNSDGNFCGSINGFNNRLQIIDNTSNQYSGLAEFSVDRQWYDDRNPGDNIFLGVKWKIIGINGTINDNLPTSLSLTGGSGFGAGNAVGAVELASYDFNDINGSGPGGDGVFDTGNQGAGWDTQVTSVDLGSSAYDYLLVVFRAGATTTGAVEVPVRFDNVTLTTVPEPASVALLGMGACALLLGRRRV